MWIVHDAFRLRLRLAAAPADCLFIDDRPENVAGARAAGLHAWLHRDNSSTIARVSEHLGR